MFLLECSLPIASADHAGALFQSMFLDSKVAQYYISAQTKITCVMY